LLGQCAQRWRTTARILFYLDVSVGDWLNRA
jgi:hypothetical protein